MKRLNFIIMGALSSIVIGILPLNAYAAADIGAEPDQMQLEQQGVQANRQYDIQQNMQNSEELNAQQQLQNTIENQDKQLNDINPPPQLNEDNPTPIQPND